MSKSSRSCRAGVVGRNDCEPIEKMLTISFMVVKKYGLKLMVARIISVIVNIGRITPLARFSTCC
jgi:hypothetical protein